MFLTRIVAVALVGCGLAACSTQAPPSSFSNAVRTDSGIQATGSASMSGGAGAATPGAGNLATKVVQ